MKVKRYKRIRKILAFYHLTHHIRSPYRVIVDPEFIQACKDGRIMIKDQLAAMFHADTAVFVTQCTINHFANAGERAAAALFIGKTLGVLPCRHRKDRGTLEPHACIKALITHQRQGVPSPLDDSTHSTREYNHECLIVGAQQAELRGWCREKPGVPVLFVHGSVPVMEQPSDDQRSIDRKTELTDTERRAVEAVTGGQALPVVRKQRRKSAKGPNPLSVKKKQKKTQQQQPSQKAKEGTKRARTDSEKGNCESDSTNTSSKRHKASTDGDSSRASASHADVGAAA